MIFPRIKFLLTHLAAAVFGMAAFAIVYFCIRSHISRDLAMMTCSVAQQSYSAGKADEAIFLLGQASAEDQRYYEPLNLLANIYLHKGNQELALETFRKALEIFDREGDPLLPPRASVQARNLICKNIDALRKQLGERHSR
jgi:tetratricopeptide (TPR) repeat protein